MVAVGNFQPLLVPIGIKDRGHNGYKHHCQDQQDAYTQSPPHSSSIAHSTRRIPLLAWEFQPSPLRLLWLRVRPLILNACGCANLF